MAVTAYPYPKALQLAFNKEIDFDTDDIRAALVGSGYTPSDAHDYWDDVVANEVTGTGYTANGVALASKTVTFLDDGSATGRANSTAYALGDVVRPATANGHLYVCIVAGTSSGTPPTFPTISRQTVTDGGVTWAEAGRAMVTFDAANPSWASSTITARYCVLYDRTPGTDATRPLLFLVDFGQNESSSNGTFEVQFSNLGIYRTFGAFPF